MYVCDDMLGMYVCLVWLVMFGCVYVCNVCNV